VRYNWKYPAVAAAEKASVSRGTGHDLVLFFLHQRNKTQQKNHFFNGNNAVEGSRRITGFSAMKNKKMISTEK
jgi:hypothetical protein